MTGPLAGIRVVDLTHVLNGPFATMLLAHMGAEVIKIEHGSGDRFRHSWMNPEINRDGYESLVVNANKKAIGLDVKTPEGRKLFERLVAISDVVVTNLSQEATERLGISYNQLSAINPRIIVSSSTGYGPSGPYANARAFAPTVRALSGWTHTARRLGGVEGEGKRDHGIADELAGISLALGVCAALVRRATTGVGQDVHVSMLDAQLGFMITALHTHFEGREVGLPPTQCADGYVHFHIPDMSNTTWSRLCTALGHPEAIADERFADLANRRKNMATVDDLLRSWVRPLPRAKLWNLFSNEGIACAPVLSVEEMLEHDTVKSAESFVDVPHSEAGVLRMLRPWIRFGADETRIESAGPKLGEHNKEVFKELLGLDQESYDALVARNVIQFDRG